MTTPIPATVADTERALNILRDLKLWMVGKPAGPNQSVDAVIEILTIAAGAPAETAKAVDMDVVRTIAEVISNGASVQGVKFALQLLGVPVCYGCDYVKAHCRCAAPQIDATTAETAKAGEMALLAAVQAICISADQEWCRQSGVLSEFDKGWFTGQMHILDSYTPTPKDAIEKARTYLEKLSATPQIASTSASACGACQGSGWVSRDADIGTEQECFSCGGSGESDEETAPATAPDVAKDAARLAIEEALEGVEILTDFMRSVEKHGNYSVEATLTFIGQAKQCFAAMCALPPAGSEK